MSYENFAGIPKRLKGQAWKACRSVTRCQGSNPCSCAIVKLKNSLNSGFFNILMCDGHVTNLTGESPAVGSYRQA